MKDSKTFTYPRYYVPFWFEQKKLSIKSNLVLNTEGKAYELATAFNSMWLDYREQLHAFNSKADKTGKTNGFPEKDLSKALEEFVESERQKALDEIKQKIKCTGENLDELRAFLIAMTGKCDDVELAVLAHMIWQVKRKMFNKKVHQHVMVILRGNQAAGKTEAIKTLFSIIKPWFNGASLKEITDDRWKYFLKISYAIFCDEMQHAEWANVDTLKNIITAEEFATRRLGFNLYDTVVQNCTFVGATNRSVGEIIRDPTGMRRFFEIETLPKMDWGVIGKADTLKIWQGIDENRNKTYISKYEIEVGARQAELILPDTNDEFIKVFRLADGTPETRSEFVLNSRVYRAYSSFTRDNGERARPNNSFHRYLKSKGIEAKREGKNGAKGYMVIKASAEMINKFHQGDVF